LEREPKRRLLAKVEVVDENGARQRSPLLAEADRRT
jgi:hypothetical protein